MGWSILGDICIHEGKLLGCSYYRNSVGVWVADISVVTFTSFILNDLDLLCEPPNQSQF